MNRFWLHFLSQQGGDSTNTNNGLLYTVGSTIVLALAGVVRYLFVRQENAFTALLEEVRKQLTETKGELSQTKAHVQECQDDREVLRRELTKLETRCAIVERKVENGGG